MSSTDLASAAANGEEPPLKKPSTEAISIHSLPDDLLLSCLACVSRLYYPTLSLVCKRFRSLLAPPEIYQARSFLGRTESCLFVCLQFPPDPNPRWFTLSRKPDKTLTNHIATNQNQKKKKKEKEKEKPSGNLLIPISVLNSPPKDWSALVAVGPYLYAIENAPYSTNVSFLDCRTRTWLEAPRLRLADNTMDRLDGNMYLPGSSENPDSLNCVEVFNTKTQTWKPVPDGKRICEYRNLEGKILISGDDGVASWAVKPKEMTGEMIGSDMNHPSRLCVCVIDDIAFSYNSYSEFQWRDMDGKERGWRKLRGFKRISKFVGGSSVRLVGCGGKMMVLWDKCVPGTGYKEIWCAVVGLVRRSNEEVSGKVESLDALLRVPKGYKFVYAIAATL
uniref:Putative F-box/kelch-repeat protein n=1 Tax=Noccaea caerulescens TaxID=107243 RepID=A0A1J3I153_NOCCA